MITAAILISLVTMHPFVRAEGLIPQLGSRSFVSREKAGKELVALGRGSVLAIVRGTKSTDPEIEERCKRLLPLAEAEAIRQRVAFILELPPKPVPPDVPLAKRLFALTGDTLDARKLYVTIYLANSQVLDSIDRSGPKGKDVFWEWVSTTLNPPEPIDFKGTMDRSPLPRKVLSEGDVALFWLLSIDPAFKPTKSASLARQIAEFDNSPAAREAVVAKHASALRSLFLTRLGTPPDYGSPGAEATCVQSAFKLAADAKLSEARPIALKVALDKKQWHIARAAALMALMQIGTDADILDVSALISDEDPIGSGNGVQTQLGDVALAACIVLSNCKLKDFGFRNADAGIAEGSSDALHLGFADDSQRRVARESWKQVRKDKLSQAGGKR